MLKQIQSKTNWIDITNPKQADIDYLASHFKFHPLILAELIPPSSRSKVEIYDGYLFIVHHLPVYNTECQTSQPTEIDFLITKNTVITVRYSRIEPLDQFFTRLEKDVLSREQFLNKTTGHLLYEILERSLNFSLRQLTHITEKIQKAEESIFKGKEKEMIKELSIIKRDILDQRQITRPQKLILESLLAKGVNFFGKDIEIYFNDLLGDYEKIWDALDDLKETAEALEATNNTLFESKMNEVMKLLTIMAFITFPLSLLSNIFSMNTKYTPLVEQISGFWIIIGTMLLISFGFFVWFKIKKWL